VLNTETKKLNQNNVHLNIIGDLSIFPEKTQKLAIQAQQELQQNTGLNLVIAANYSGQWDIVEATKKIAAKSVNEKLRPKDIDDKVFEKHTSLAKYPPVDLLIRTSGEVRLSNFLLWDIAYSELYFCNTLWPDFGTKDLNLAIENFHARDRRYGSYEDK
jgi:undecaprenyl diphosphate synthase